MSKLFFVFVFFVLFFVVAGSFFSTARAPPPIFIRSDVNGEDVNVGSLFALKIDANSIFARYYVAQNWIDYNFLNKAYFFNDVNVAQNVSARKFQSIDANSVFGIGATALGSGTTAFGAYSTATGYNTTASGWSSIAMGFGTRASGDYSLSAGSYSHVMSASSLAFGYFATAGVKKYSCTYTDYLQTITISGDVSGEINAYDVLQLLNYDSATVYSATATNVEFNGSETIITISEPLGSDIYVGYLVDLSQASSGFYNTAMGYNTTALEMASTAFGFGSTASGDYSTATGYNTTASGYASTVTGDSTIASGWSSIAMGFGTRASGDISTAIGFSTIASGDASTAIGLFTTASGYASTAIGISTTASEEASTALGYNTTAFGAYSTATGYNSQAVGMGSIAMGYGDFDKGPFAIGDGSIALGYSDTNLAAVGKGSIALGYNVKALGEASVALGKNLTNYYPNSVLVNDLNVQNDLNVMSSLAVGKGIRMQVGLSDGDINAAGSVFVDKNIFGSVLFAQSWRDIPAGESLNFAAANTWYQFDLSKNFSGNGFAVVDKNILVQKSGLYEISYNAEGSGVNNHTYVTTVAVNDVNKDECVSRKMLAAGGDVVPMASGCFLRLNSNDKIKLVVMDFGGTGLGTVYHYNFRIKRISN